MFSVLGGIFGALVLCLAAPALVEVALKFSSFEYFWLLKLGISSVIFIAGKDVTKGCVSMLLGLLIPLMIGMFAVSEVLRFALARFKPEQVTERPFGNVCNCMGRLIKTYWLQLLRCSTLGTLIGALPGADADIAAWMSYAISMRFSKEPKKFGSSRVEGIVEAGAANNSPLGGA